ncbi:MAG TPA: lysylphosphatidylglycerol synthase domain-containing protein [Ramlibacter sp.]|nr:lysylphosphatidylglycerol synthase domain-containing protein [Ramlibacter sp.]
MTVTLPRNSLVKPRPHRHAPAPPSHWRSQPWWAWTKRALSVLFFAAVVVLLVRYGRNVDWDEVVGSVRNTPGPALFFAAVLAASSHLLYSCFDLIGRRYTGHSLPTLTVMAVNFISYAFNLCIGSLVGGVGFRYRLYSRLGLKNGVITRVVSMSMLTNWLGYMLIAGSVFLFHPLELPPSWKMGNHGLQWIGALLVAVALGYIVACVKYGNHSWTIRGHEIDLPQWRMALLQLTMSCINWSLMAGVIYVLLGERVQYTDVLTVLLIGAIAGVVAHVPAGLGVFEFIFVALLSHQVSEGRLIGALLGYRAIYYIVPLMLAAGLYLFMEVHAKKQKHTRRRLATHNLDGEYS